MPTGFAFPPPPPPPPKAALPDQPYVAEQPFFTHPRGSRGGGRGGRGDRRGGRGLHHGGGHQDRSQRDQSSFDALPAGAYVNPAFAGQRQNPASSNGRNAAAPVPLQEAYNAGQKRKWDQHETYNMPTGSWKQSQGQRQDPRPHPMRNPTSRPGPEVPPAVPSFGSYLPPLVEPSVSQSRPARDMTKPQRVQRPSNKLGLTPHRDMPSDESDGDEEDLDEEAAYAGQAPSSVTFEYNGEVSRLDSHADVKAWINERKRLWPSRRRIEEKAGERRSRQEERKRIEQETRAAAGFPKATVWQKPAQAPQQPTGSAPQSDIATLDQARRELEKQMGEVERLRGQLAASESRKAQRQADALAENVSDPSRTQPQLVSYDDDDEPEDSNIAPESGSARKEEDKAPSPISSSSDQEGSDSVSDSDSDAAPEEVSSKGAEVPGDKAAPSRREPTTQICRIYNTGGKCKFGTKCRYKHIDPGPDARAQQSREPRKEQPVVKRKSLFERLVEQEKDEENAMALQAIKYLGNIGFFRKLAQDNQL